MPRAAMPIALALLTVLAVFAGCTGNGSPDTTVPAPVTEPSWAVKAIFAGADPDETGRVADHDHSNRSLHQGLSTPNFKVLGHDPLLSPYYGASPGTSYCGDVSAKGAGTRQLAVVHSLSSDVAISVLDVTDRAAPKEIGELVLPYAFTYDAAIFADGKYAVIAANPDLSSDSSPTGGAPSPGGASTPITMQWRTACGTVPVGSKVDNTPYGYSTILVDLSDPANPVVADFFEYPAGRNVHSISTTTIDGTRWVATSGLAALPCTVPSVAGNPVPAPIPCEPQVPRFGNALSHFDFFQVVQGPTGAKLQPFAFYFPSDQQHLDPSLLYLANGHTDATVAKHPLTNQTLAYLADWDGGLIVVRLDTSMSTPAGSLDNAPSVTAIASWGKVPGDDPTQMRGNIHSVWPVPDTRKGHAYLLVGQEVVGRPTGRPSGQVDLVDISVPNQPIQQAKWTLPVDVLWPPSAGELFSTHYPILLGDTLYVSLYHGGVWAADAREANWPDLPSIGVFIPAMDPAGTPRTGGTAPEVLEVLPLGDNDGSLLVYDGGSGAYTVQFTGASPDVPPAAPWADNPWIG